MHSYLIEFEKKIVLGSFCIYVTWEQVDCVESREPREESCGMWTGNLVGLSWEL